MSASKHRRSWREKLADDKDLPKVVKITPAMAHRFGTGTVAIPAPREVDAIMRQVPRGRLITINLIRERIAQAQGATIGCPMTTGIFAWIAAHAAEEARQAGVSRITPWWRTLKNGGELNPKYPGGIDQARQFLEAEGHRIVVKGQRVFVDGYERRLVNLQKKKASLARRARTSKPRAAKRRSSPLAESS
ncbi:MAG: hypothetical protein ACKV0T_11705 [Planctomycetales bacterium]